MTEQDIIDGNIKLHNYFTGREWKKPQNYHDVHNNTLVIAVSSGKDTNWLKYHSAREGFYDLWQVLQKIERDKELYKWSCLTKENILLISTLFNHIEQLSDPIDIFWSLVELLNEYDKYNQSLRA